MRILLVDDEEGMITIWKRWLEPLLAEIRVANDVESAIAQMKRIPPPDLVLLDLILKNGDGAETVGAIIKLREFNPQLTVIVISGMDEERLLKAIADAPVDGFLLKGDEITQTRLLNSMMVALKKTKSSELLDYVGRVVDSLMKEETKRKTGKIV